MDTLVLPDQLLIENIGAPSPPGPSVTVATPPSSQQTFTVGDWPDNLPWLAFVGSLNARLTSLHQSREASQAFQQGRPTSQSRTQHILPSSNDNFLLPQTWRSFTYIITSRDRLDLIDAMWPRSTDSSLITDVHNSMSLLSTTSSHWALKLLIYLASNNLLELEDLPRIWRLLEETGVKNLANLSKSLELGETSLQSALEYLFEAGLEACDTEIVSWLLDLGIDANKMVRSIEGYLHLPLVLAMDSRFQWKIIPMVRLLLSMGASPLLRCCEGHNTATHFAILDPESETESLELILQAILKTQNRQPESRFREDFYQDDGTQSNNCEGQRSEDEVSLKLELLVDALEQSFTGNPPPWATLASPKALVQAVTHNNHNLVRIIHKRRVSMNTWVDNGGWGVVSPLDMAVRRKPDPIRIVRLLLELGASPNYSPDPEWGGTCSRALQIAVHEGEEGSQGELIKILIEHGASFRGSVHCMDRRHHNLMDCALGAAYSRVNLEAVEVLHDAGLPLSKGPAALMSKLESIHGTDPYNKQGVAERFAKLIQFLALKTTDFTLQSREGWTALDYTISMGMREAGELMFEKGALHSRKFVHDYCLSDWFRSGNLDTLLARAPKPRTDKQRGAWLFYRVIGTLRARNACAGDILAPPVRVLILEYCKLPRSPKHEAYIVLQACLTKDVYLIGLTLQYFPNVYSSAALEALIWCQTQTSVDYWEFIKELLRRRSESSSPFQRLQEKRLFSQFAYCEMTGKGDPRILEWFHRYDKEAFNLAKLHSVLIINAFHIPDYSDSGIKHHATVSWDRQLSRSWEELDIDQLCKRGLKASTYLGLLMVARGQYSQLSVLLHHGLHVDRRFPWSLTMLQFAVARGDLAMSRELLKAGANVNARPSWRDIPGALYKRIPRDLVTLFTVDRVFEKNQRTALQSAAEQGNISMIRLLLEFGADVNAPPPRVGGATALQLACMQGYIDIVRLLVQKGANVNAAGARYNGRTALEGAAGSGRLDVVFFLLGRGCLVHFSFRKQYIRAVGFARAQAHHTVATELQNYGDWTEDDEAVLRSTYLGGTLNPPRRALEVELDDDEEVSEIDFVELLPERPDLFPPEMVSESESEGCDSFSDDEEVISPDEDSLQAHANEVGNSQQAAETSAIQLDTWDDLIEYYGDDEEVDCGWGSF